MGLGFGIKGGDYRGSRWFIGRCTGVIGMSGVWGLGVWGFGLKVWDVEFSALV